MTHFPPSPALRFQHSVRSSSKRLLWVFAIAGLLSCSANPEKAGNQSASPTGPAVAGAAAGASGADGSGAAASGTQELSKYEPRLYPGSGQFIGAPTPVADPPAADGEGMPLTFSDADIRAVVSTILGDALGLTFSIDPSIKGTLTLQSAKPLQKNELLAALEAALRMQDIAIVESGGTYNVVPMKDAPKHISGVRSPQSARAPGFGIQAVPLKYTSAADMEKLLLPFAPQGALVRVDEARNLLLLAGTGQELAALQDIVQTFDVDWMAGMSYGLFPLEYVDAKTIAEELKEIYNDPKSPINGVVRFVPVARLNALLVVSPQADYLKQVETWVKRLDLGETTPGRHIYVYDVQNGKASDLAGSLNHIFSTGNDASAAAASPSTTARSSAGSGPVPAPSPGSNPSSAFVEGTGLRIVPNEDNNSLLVFAMPSEFSVIEGALKRLDVTPRQVLIEASLAEVSLNDDLKFGIQWSYQFNKGVATLSDNAAGAIASKFPGFSYVYAGASSVQAVLNTLESITDVKVLSAPKLMVLNNHEALLQVGDQVPIVTQSAVSTAQLNAPIVNSVQMRDTGVILRVTPRVNKGGMVLMDISQEVSSVVPTTSSGIDSPTIQQRKLSSSIAVHDGETIALGGLIRDNQSRGKTGLPWLVRIPLIGSLFGNTVNSGQRTELIVLIRPRVIWDANELHQLMGSLHEQFKNTTPPVRNEPAPAAKPH